MDKQINKLFGRYDFKLNENQINQFEKYLEYLKQESDKYNLTAIKEDKEIIIKHFIDSVLPINYVNGKVLDVGSGAGFPGFPLKIAKSELQMTFVDALQKRINFLNELKDMIGLESVKAIHSRIEDMDNSYKNSFDTVVSRAVAKLSTLLEYCLPFVKVGGYMVAYKSIGYKEELAECNNALNVLGGKVEEVIKYELEDQTRYILLIKKEKDTNLKYPRKQNKPKTNPL